MSAKVIIVNGRPGSGKTTFEELCKKSHPFSVRIISTVTFVKKVAKFCGWNGEKTPVNRRFLSDLKYLLAEWADIPYQHVAKTIRKFTKKKGHYIIFVDSREPNEIARFKKEFNAMTVLIRRPGDEDIKTSNSADAEVFNYTYDLTIQNNSDILNLEKEAKNFIKNLYKGEYK